MASRGPGRPSKLTEKLAAEICRRIAEGESLRAICREEGMPALSTVLTWALGQTEDSDELKFPEQYARARAVRSELYADEIVTLADDKEADPQRSRLQVDARKWIASKLLPKTYGDKVALTGADGGPLVSRVEVVLIDGQDCPD